MRQSLVAICLVVLCVGCGQKTTDTDDTVGALRRANIAEPSTLDPHRSEGVSSGNVLRDLFEGLVTENPDGSLAPGAAQRWTLSEDGLTYTFTLRANARWSNGDPVVAADFVAGMQRTLDPKTNSTYAQLLSSIVNASAINAGKAAVDTLGVTAVTDNILEIRLRQPTSYFLGLLTNPATFPLHRTSYEAFGDNFVRTGNMVSNGPYQLDDWRIGDRLIATRNPYYWDAGAVSIGRVEFLPIEDAATELNMFRAGELDMTSQVPNTLFQSLSEAYPDQLRVAPLLGIYFLVFDTTEPPFDDVRAREALTIAVDRDDLVNVVLGTGQPGAWGMVPPGVDGYRSFVYPWQQWPREQQLARAREQYAAAGYSEQSPLKAALLYNTSDNHKKNAVAVQGMLRSNLGAAVSLVNQEWKVMLQTRNDFGSWDLLRFGWNGDYNDASTFLELFRSDNPQNAAGWKDAAYDQMLETAATEVDPAVRAELLFQAESYLMQQYPILPLYFYASKHLVSDRVEGFSSNIMDHNYTKHLSLTD